jgi:lysozyme family protein
MKVKVRDEAERELLQKKFITDFVIKWEGGYVYHPNDPGGCTKYGITLSTLTSFRKKGNLTCSDIQRLQIEEAIDIYMQVFCRNALITNVYNQIGPKTMCCCLDFTINSGSGNVVQVYQYLIERNVLDDEGVNVVNNYRRAFLNNIIKRNNRLSVFRTGWFNRINALEKYVFSLNTVS